MGQLLFKATETRLVGMIVRRRPTVFFIPPSIPCFRATRIIITSHFLRPLRQSPAALICKMSQDEARLTQSKDPSTRENSSDKQQPWRELYPCLEATLVKHGSFHMETSTGKIPDQWNDLERGRLPANHTELLSKLVRERFNGKPWYKKEGGGKRCDNCGCDPCICTVFEGG